MKTPANQIRPRSRRKPLELVVMRNPLVSQKELNEAAYLNNSIQNKLSRLVELTARILQKIQSGATVEGGMRDVKFAVREYGGRYEEVLLIDHHELWVPRPPSTYRVERVTLSRC